MWKPALPDSAAAALYCPLQAEMSSCNHQSYHSFLAAHRKEFPLSIFFFCYRSPYKVNVWQVVQPPAISSAYKFLLSGRSSRGQEALGNRLVRLFSCHQHTSSAFSFSFLNGPMRRETSCFSAIRIFPELRKFAPGGRKWPQLSHLTWFVRISVPTSAFLTRFIFCVTVYQKTIQDRVIRTGKPVHLKVKGEPFSYQSFKLKSFEEMTN